MAGRWIYKKQVKNKADGTKVQWSDKKKLEAVTTYLATGNQNLTCKLTGVPETTFVHWRKTEWFKDLIAEVRAQEGQKTDSRMTAIIDQALEAINDRLLHGDYILDSKTGEIKRIPPKMKDTAQVLDKIMDKRQLIRKEPTKYNDNVVKLEDQLKKIADQFEIMVRGRTPQEIEVEDAEIIEDDDYDAVSEEWEEGLQTGERVIQLETEGEEEESHEERREAGNG